MMRLNNHDRYTLHGRSIVFDVPQCFYTLTDETTWKHSTVQTKINIRRHPAIFNAQNGITNNNNTKKG